MNRCLALVAFGSTLGLCAASCGGGETEDSTASTPTGGRSGATGQAGADNQAGAGVGLPPSEPEGPVADGTTPTVLAVTRLFLGDADRDGNLSADAWQQFGYNLDGLVSTADDEDHCTPVEGADADVKDDGPNGVDNAFGHKILPVIQGLEARPSENASGQIESGVFTYLFRFNNLGGGPTQTGVDAALFHGAPLSEPPLFDGTDVWPVTAESVQGGNLDSPRVVFPTSYVTSGAWVSGAKTDFQLFVTLAGVSLLFDLHGAVITMDVSGSGSEATAVNGIIAGVLEQEQLVEEFRRALGAFNPALCSGVLADTLLANVRRASDIMLDGTNGDASQTCNAVSVGLGFEASAANLGEVAPEQPPRVDPCAE
jgi:hypothetical protein